MKAELKRRIGVIVFVSFSFVLFTLFFRVLGVVGKNGKGSSGVESFSFSEATELFSKNLLGSNSSDCNFDHRNPSSCAAVSVENLTSEKVHIKEVVAQAEEKNSDTLKTSDNKNLKSQRIDSVNYELTCPSFSENYSQNQDKIKVSASCGISPIYFMGNNFINNYFPKQTFIFLPCLTFSVVFPSKTSWNYGIIFQGTGSKLEHSVTNYSNNLDLIMSTQFFSFHTAFLLQKQILSPQNLLAVHAGIGITNFFNSLCQIGTAKSSPVNSATLFFNCGLSLKHNFAKNIFCNVSFSINYAISPSETFIFFEPAITGGILI